jgi:hypothetical protein
MAFHTMNRRRAWLATFAVVAVAAVASGVTARQTIAHSDRNRCLQAQHVWTVATLFATDQNAPQAVPAPLAHQRVFVDLYRVGNDRRRHRLNHELHVLGRRPHC